MLRSCNLFSIRNVTFLVLTLEQRAKKYLTDEVNYEVLQLATKSQCSFRHLESLRAIRKFLKNPPQRIVTESEQYIYQTIQNYLKLSEQLSPYEHFQPTLQKTISQLQAFDWFFPFF